MISVVALFTTSCLSLVARSEDHRDGMLVERVTLLNLSFPTEEEDLNHIAIVSIYEDRAPEATLGLIQLYSRVKDKKIEPEDGENMKPASPAESE